MQWLTTVLLKNRLFFLVDENVDNDKRTVQTFLYTEFFHNEIDIL